MRQPRKVKYIIILFSTIILYLIYSLSRRVYLSDKYHHNFDDDDKCIINDDIHELWSTEAKKHLNLSGKQFVDEKDRCERLDIIGHPGRLLIPQDGKDILNPIFYFNETRLMILHHVAFLKMPRSTNFSKPFKCRIISFERVTDFKIKRGEHLYSFPLSDDLSPISNMKRIVDRYPFLLIPHEYFIIECVNFARRNPIFYQEVYYNFNSETIFRMYKEKEKRNKDDLNFLIIGIDSVSSTQFRRMLPKTFDRLTKKMGAIWMKNSFVVGENTRPNLYALLAGLMSNEMLYYDDNNHRVVNEMADAHLFEKEEYTDPLPTLWRLLPKRFVTYFQEDYTRIGMFKFAKKGFHSPPVDIFLTPYYVMIENDRTPVNICNQSKEFYWTLLSFLKKMILMEKSFFALNYFDMVTHDCIDDVVLLEESLSFIFDYYEENLKNNTVLIFFGDHGSRIGSYYDTERGLKESRKSMMFLKLPQSYMKDRKNEMENLKFNSNQLITMFDVHHTLVYLIHQLWEKGSVNNFYMEMMYQFYFMNIQKDLKKILAESKLSWRSLNKRGRNLLSEKIPQRSCIAATISIMFCPCEREMNVFELNGKQLNKLYETIVGQLDHILSNLKNSSVRCLSTGKVKMNETWLGDRVKFDGNTQYLIIGIKFRFGEIGKFLTFIFMKYSPTEISTKIMTMTRLDRYSKTSSCLSSFEERWEAYCICR
ncbi:hypothetical protein SNEBB_009320 [Seison nebaliae]|nr:hypothetical protein SNEBB_009320 [Seison nebaliae]